MEIWIPISEMDGFYEVSDLGRVRRAKKSRGSRIGKLTSLANDKDGYVVVTLHVAGLIRNRKVHRLVATEFIANPESLPEINHKDGDKTNNKVGNLEWCTHPDNQDHARKLGLMASGSRNGAAKLTEADVLEIRTATKSGPYLARLYGVSVATISLIKRRKTWRHV